MRIRYILAVALGLVVDCNSVASESGLNHKNWRNVQQWLVEAESATLPIAENLGGVPLRTQVARRIIVATSGDQLTYFVGHPDESTGIDWKNEPFNLDMRIRNQQLVKHYRFNRSVEFADFKRASTIPDPICRDAVFFFFPIWPLKGYAAPHVDDPGMIFVVEEAVRSNNYEATSERTLVNGQWCRLTRSKSNLDRIWIAEDKELCVVRREWYTNARKTIMGELSAKEVREMAPGLWLPVLIEMKYYGNNGRNEKQELIGHTETRIVRCEIDENVPAETLEVTFRPGTIDITSADKVRQLSPGGTEHLLEVADFFRDHMGLPQRATVSNHLVEATLQVLIGVLGGSIIVSVPWWRVMPDKLRARWQLAHMRLRC